MSYELFRSDVLENMEELLPPDYIQRAINAVDRAAIGRKATKDRISKHPAPLAGEPLQIYVYFVNLTV